MSYSPRHAQTERDQEVTEALQTRDSGALYRLAGLYKEEGEDEQAEVLRFAAKKFDDEDWSFDRARDEDLLG